MKNILLIISSLIILISCSKENDIRSVQYWSNSNNIGKGTINGIPSESKISIYSDGKTLQISLTKRDIDSVLIEQFSFLNVPIHTGDFKLNRYSFLTDKIYSTYDAGYGDVLSTFCIDSTKNNVLSIKTLNLDKGIINGVVNAVYLYKYGIPTNIDTIRIKDFEFTYSK